MRETDTVIIGGGQAGLAMSYALMRRGIDHVVLERGRVGERWRSQRWDSLRLLTPNWQTRLPGMSYQGADPHGYMGSSEFAAVLEGYAEAISAPVQGETDVLRVTRRGGRFVIATDRGPFRARTVVIATGYAAVPSVPTCASDLESVYQLTPDDYKNPGQLPPGGVLVVGASATGVQLAREISRSGHAVSLSVGRHIRLPRTYRGRDIMWWLDTSGILSERAEQHPDIERARRQPSLQLVGSDDRRNADLASLSAEGIDLLGRFDGASGSLAFFSGDLRVRVAEAERRMARILRRIDHFAQRSGLDDVPADQPAPFTAATPPRELDLRARGIRTVLWATGYQRSYPWMAVDALDARGELIHRGGVTPVPGLFALGLMFMRRRNSNYIDGVGRDAEEIADSLCRHLDESVRLVA